MVEGLALDITGQTLEVVTHSLRPGLTSGQFTCRVHLGEGRVGGREGGTEGGREREGGEGGRGRE